MEMIGRLPPNYRTVLNLFVFEQRSHKEIASQLGIKENSSSSIFFRAKRMLAKMITEHQNKQGT
jgi:RNA polymerase sigma-70 factor (ECF subfamily)